MLMLLTLQTLPLKNFRDEIRASRDLEKFLVQPVVLLDVHYPSKLTSCSEFTIKMQTLHSLLISFARRPRSRELWVRNF